MNCFEDFQILKNDKEINNGVLLYYTISGMEVLILNKNNHVNNLYNSFLVCKQTHKKRGFDSIGFIRSLN